MKTFKLYIKEGGTKTQLIWLGALLIIIGIVIACLGIYNYFTIPQESIEEFIYSPHALILKELYLSAGMGVIGIILLMAGAFAANSHANTKEEEGQNN
ncbi:hypothetical protein KKG58_00170 [Patescibacteria group bacterium]|nr:hypothetical protein [Patescibacteria group bacterium]